MFHITFHITHQYTTTFYTVSPLMTSRITPPDYHVSRRVHIAQRSTFHATAHTPVHITPPLFITPFPFERLVELALIRYLDFHSHTAAFYTTYQTQHKNGGEKVQLY